jgi:hypothetical protein
VSYSFLPEAEIEYLQAVRFYEDQRPGLDERLMSSAVAVCYGDSGDWVALRDEAAGERVDPAIGFLFRGP